MHHKPRKRGRYVIIVVILLLLFSFFRSSSLHPPRSVVIKKGDTIQGFLSPLPFTQRLSAKWYLMRHSFDTKKLQLGTYVFSGDYTPAAYFKQIQSGPSQEYIRYTMLEGRSIYDIDADMTSKDLIKAGDFIKRSQSIEEIQKLSQTFSFLMQDKQLTTLEGFLYPDTYFLSANGDVITQLQQAALRRREEKIHILWKQYSSKFAVALQPYGITLSLPGAVTLASIIEKEERSLKEKPTIAGIFLNRLQKDISLGADITLCYGRQQPYETCTPKLIAQYIGDNSNIYNTRVKKGLTPTPISSVTADTFKALLQFKSTNYIFYLHDSQGVIHYAITNAEHEQNKSTYLQ